MAVNENDKYYTPHWLVEHSVKKTIEIIGKENITDVIEPSAGDGAYIETLKKYFKHVPLSFYDLYPEHPEVIEKDYYKLRKSYKKGRLVIGNPPYGVASNLWRGFCKKSAKIADYISFISPASQYNSNYYFKQGELIYSELLDDVVYRGSEVENGKEQAVRTCLNIYKVYDRDEEVDWRETKILSQVKFGRLYRDQDEHYEYYMSGMSSKTTCFVCKRDDFQVLWGITVLDESIREKMETFINGFYKHHDELVNQKAGPAFIDKRFFLSKLKKFLYPTRDERLEQDIFIKQVNVYRDGKTDGDFFIKMIPYSHKIMDECPDNGNCVVVKVLNDSVKENVRTFLEQVEILNLSSNDLKDKLKQHLYPKRDEINDTYFTLKGVRHDDSKYDLFINSYHEKVSDKKESIWDYGLLVHKDFDKIKELSETYMKTEINEFRKLYATGNASFPVFNHRHFRDWMSKQLLPDDDFEYEEVKQPIEIEREFWCKELF